MNSFSQKVQPLVCHFLLVVILVLVRFYNTIQYTYFSQIQYNIKNICLRLLIEFKNFLNFPRKYHMKVKIFYEDKQCTFAFII